MYYKCIYIMYNTKVIYYIQFKIEKSCCLLEFNKCNAYYE